MSALTHLISPMDRTVLDIYKLRSTWALTSDDIHSLRCDLQFMAHLPNCNPLDLFKAVEINKLPVVSGDSILPNKHAELCFPSNSRRRCLEPRFPIEHASTLLLYRKHRSGKWVVLAMPVWDFSTKDSVFSFPEITLELLRAFNSTFPA